MNFRREKQQLFERDDLLFKAPTASLALELLAREKWRCYGNYKNQNLRSECTCSAIVRKRTMERQRVNLQKYSETYKSRCFTTYTDFVASPLIIRKE